jgi:hypothetical protein
MSDTLKVIIQNACTELSLTQPNAIVSSTDKQVLQLLAYANRAGKEIADYPVRGNGWSFLQKKYYFESNFLVKNATSVIDTNVLTLVDTTGILVGFGVTGDNIPPYSIVTAITPTTVTLSSNQFATSSDNLEYIFSQIAYSLPSDYENLIPNTYYQLNNTAWWSTQLTTQQAAFIQANNGLVPTPYFNRFRIVGDNIIIDPYPTSNLPYSLLYTSNGWVVDADDNTIFKNKFTKDDDQVLIDDDLLTLSVIWRFRASQGASYDEDYQIYSRKLERLSARDGGGAGILDLSNSYRNNGYLSIANVPWGNYGNY